MTEARPARPSDAGTAKGTGIEDRDWQRLDTWLWCVRLLKSRAGCARLVGLGGVRINRLATEKPHARLRPGDIVTLPFNGAVRVLRVVALARRRGPAAEARTLYDEIEESPPCAAAQRSPYPADQ